MNNLNTPRKAALTAVLLAVIPLVAGCGGARNTAPRDWVAAAGPDTVDAAEFRLRWEAGAAPGKGLAARVDFAEALLIERKLARAAREWELDSSAVARRLLRQMEDEALVQAFLAREVDARIDIGEAAMRRDFLRMIRRLRLDAWVFADSASAYAAFARIARGTPFEEAADPPMAAPLPLLLRNQELHYGQASPLFEETAYSLEVGDVSEPFPDRGRWWMLRLTGFEQERVPSEAAFASAAPSLRGTILRRLRGPQQRELIAEVMRGRSLQLDPAGFAALVQRLAPSLPEADPSVGSAPNATVTAREELLEAAGNADWLERPLVHVTGRSGWRWSGREVLERLAVMPQPLELGSGQSADQLLHAALVYLAEFEGVARDARGAGMAEDSSVTAEADRWREHVLAVRARQHLREVALSEGPSDTASRWLRARFTETPARFRLKRLRELNLTDLPVLAARTHFPLRLAVPVPAGLDLAVRLNADDGR